MRIPVLIEPLVKFLRPIIYLLKRNPGFFEGLYFLLVLGWTVATWAVFGGAIARMAAVASALFEQSRSLLWREGLHSIPGRAGSGHRLADITRDQTAAHRVMERPVQDGVSELA